METWVLFVEEPARGCPSSITEVANKGFQDNRQIITVLPEAVATCLPFAAQARASTGASWWTFNRGVCRCAGYQIASSPSSPPVARKRASGDQANVRTLPL